MLEAHLKGVLQHTGGMLSCLKLDLRERDGIQARADGQLATGPTSRVGVRSNVKDILQQELHARWVKEERERGATDDPRQTMWKATHDKYAP